MKTRFLALAAALFCCLSCIETNSLLGGSFVPPVETYNFYSVSIPLEGISMQMADDLSGYSDDRITVGAIREPEFGLTTRSSALTLIPLLLDYENFEIGKDPEFISFHFAAARDTLSFIDESQEHILQTLRVYELEQALDPEKSYNCNQTVAHRTESIAKGTPVYNGSDSLAFDFSADFGRKYLQLTAADLKDIKTYLAKFPGIYIESEIPEGEGGRINMLDVQLSYDVDYSMVMGNMATLYYSAEFDGERRDTSLNFFYGATALFDIDSLLNAYTGTFPQYALNLTGQQTRERAGRAGDKIWIEGGGGLKPVISATSLKRQVEEAVIRAGGNPKDAVINKASLVFPFEFPQDYTEMDRWPYRLSPTCRFIGTSSTTFMGLTDSSSSDENQGDVNRSLGVYAPDITYHMQEILKIDETDTEKSTTQNLLKGNYDIWLLVMAQELLTTVNTTSQEQQEMLNYMAYSSYYNSMYGGYGYGSGYGSSYSNYLNYAMMAQMASQSTTTVSTTVELDKDRFYCAALNGPEAAGKVPTLEITFALPNEE
ncbi:MAG: hypothetical protein IJV37_09025 [Bacteroidales bacterium]|nr:hypothetical protein [Bacteroidales bacterium]